MSKVEPDFFEPEVLGNFDRETAVKREVNSIGATVQEARGSAPYVSHDHAMGNLDFFEHSYPGQNIYPAGYSAIQVPNFPSVEQSGGYSNVVSSDSGSGTGIKLRPRQMQNQSDDRQFRTQGTANRRIRLQVKLQVGSVEPRSHTDSSQGPESHQAVTEVSLSSPLFLFFLKFREVFSLLDTKTHTYAGLCRLKKPRMNIVLPPVMRHEIQLVENMELVERLMT